jgi:hypothetical protein
MILHSQRPANGTRDAEVENSPSCGGRMKTQGNDGGQEFAPEHTMVPMVGVLVKTCKPVVERRIDGHL